MTQTKTPGGPPRIASVGLYLQSVLLFTVVGAVATVIAGAAAFPSTGDSASIDPAFIVLFACAVLVSSGVMYGLLKFGAESLLSWAYLLLSWYSAVVVLVLVTQSTPIVVAGAVLSLAIPAAAHHRPEWYSVSAAGLVTCVCAVGVLALLLPVWAVVVLLVLLAVYDIIAVLLTGHVAELSESFEEEGVPAVIYLPLSRSFSRLNGTGSALTLGLADVAAPSVLVAATAVAPAYGPSVAGATLVGILLSFVPLYAGVRSYDGYLPALPVLNGGALVGFVAAVILL